MVIVAIYSAFTTICNCNQVNISSTPAPSLITCTGSELCEFNIFGSNTIQSKTLQCTSNYECRIYIHDQSSGYATTLSTNGASLTTIYIYGVSGAEASTIQSSSTLTENIVVYASGDYSFKNSFVNGPYFQSRLEMHCSGRFSCEELTLSEQYSVDVELYAMGEASIRGLNGGTVAWDSAEYKRGSVLMHAGPGTVNSFQDANYVGTNHGSWTLIAESANSFGSAFVYATEDANLNNIGNFEHFSMHVSSPITAPAKAFGVWTLCAWQSNLDVTFDLQSNSAMYDLDTNHFTFYSPFGCNSSLTVTVSGAADAGNSALRQSRFFVHPSIDMSFGCYCQGCFDYTVWNRVFSSFSAKSSYYQSSGAESLQCASDATMVCTAAPAVAGFFEIKYFSGEYQYYNALSVTVHSNSGMYQPIFTMVDSKINEVIFIGNADASIRGVQMTLGCVGYLYFEGNAYQALYGLQFNPESAFGAIAELHFVSNAEETFKGATITTPDFGDVYFNTSLASLNGFQGLNLRTNEKTGHTGSVYFDCEHSVANVDCTDMDLNVRYIEGEFRFHCSNTARCQRNSIHCPEDNRQNNCQMICDSSTDCADTTMYTTNGYQIDGEIVCDNALADCAGSTLYCGTYGTTSTSCCCDMLYGTDWDCISQGGCVMRQSNPPTISPSIYPTTLPTAFPTALPTSLPSNNPSSDPSTSMPTEYPTDVPTVYPTVFPTNLPSETPTVLPTAHPTTIPTEIPSTNPTRNPSEIPSANPTFNPSAIPSANPTFNPTSIPTLKPTLRIYDSRNITIDIVVTDDGGLNRTLNVTAIVAQLEAYLEAVYDESTLITITIENADGTSTVVIVTLQAILPHTDLNHANTDDIRHEMEVSLYNQGIIGVDINIHDDMEAEEDSNTRPPGEQKSNGNNTNRLSQLELIDIVLYFLVPLSVVLIGITICLTYYICRIQKKRAATMSSDNIEASRSWQRQKQKQISSVAMSILASQPPQSQKMGTAMGFAVLAQKKQNEMHKLHSLSSNATTDTHTTATDGYQHASSIDTNVNMNIHGHGEPHDQRQLQPGAVVGAAPVPSDEEDNHDPDEDLWGRGDGDGDGDGDGAGTAGGPRYAMTAGSIVSSLGSDSNARTATYNTTTVDPNHHQHNNATNANEEEEEESSEGSALFGGTNARTETGGQ